MDYLFLIVYFHCLHVSGAALRKGKDEMVAVSRQCNRKLVIKWFSKSMTIRKTDNQTQSVQK